MGKEEKKADLEQMLNSLIEKGWLPRGEDKIHSCRYYEKEKKFKADYTRAGIPQVLYRSIRELCSREAGLWQFVCENGMVRNEKLTHNWVSQIEWGLDVDCKRKTTPKDYQYRLIESSLKDESELEDFLLQNIKVGNED